MQLTSIKACPNCSADLDSGFKFCPNCGQDTHIHRFNLAHIFHEGFHAFTHADKGVLQLIWGLTIRPGVVAREYILEGKRKKYFNPFTFLLLVLGFAVFVNSYYKPYGNPGTNPVKPKAEVKQTATPTEQAMRQRRDATFSVLNKKANLIAFAAIPLFTLVFWLFFRRTGINYAEHLVANILFAGYFQLFAAIVTLVLGLLNVHTSTVSEQQLIFQVIYLPIAYYQFLHYRRATKFLLPLLASLLAVGVWILLSSQVIRFYIMYGL